MKEFAGRVLMLVENRFPADTRVRNEAFTLAENSFRVSVIALRGHDELACESLGELVDRRRARRRAQPDGRQRRAGPYFMRHGRRCIQNCAKQPGQQHHGQRAVLDQFGIVAEAKVRDRGQKNIEHGRAAHQQQKNRLPDKFHERVARNGQKL